MDGSRLEYVPAGREPYISVCMILIIKGWNHVMMRNIIKHPLLLDEVLYMSYEHVALFDEVRRRVALRPRASLAELSRDLRVGRRTIGKCIWLSTGATFRALQRRMVLEKIVLLVKTEPTISIKEIAYAVGYRSPRAFARGLKQICGLQPAKLRAQLLTDLAHLATNANK